MAAVAGELAPEALDTESSRERSREGVKVELGDGVLAPAVVEASSTAALCVGVEVTASHVLHEKGRSRGGRGRRCLRFRWHVATCGREGGLHDSASGGERGGRWCARWRQVMGRGTMPRASRE